MHEQARIVRLDQVAFTIEPWSWPFVVRRRTDIDDYFALQKQANPFLWNGRLLLLHSYAEADGALNGTFFETDYASMIAGIAWREIGRNVKACFGVSALLSSDNAFIVGLMAAYTRNDGMLCFPSGSVELDDVKGTTVDIESCVRRELTEETGLTVGDIDIDIDWYAAFAGPRLPMFKIMRAHEPADALRERILANLARQDQPEFIDIKVLRGPGDLDKRLPDWMRLFLDHAWSDPQLWRSASPSALRRDDLIDDLPGAGHR